MEGRVKATLTKWAAVELYTESGKTAELVIFGTPDNAPGEFVLTSAVENIEQETDGSALVKTRNSTYRVDSAGRHFKLPLLALPLLREGHDPEVLAAQYVRPRVDVKEALTKRKRNRFSGDGENG